MVPPAVPAVPTSLLLRHLERLSRALPYIDWKGANNGGNNGGPATGGGGASAHHTTDHTDHTDPLLVAAQKTVTGMSEQDLRRALEDRDMEWRAHPPASNSLDRPTLEELLLPEVVQDGLSVELAKLRVDMVENHARALAAQSHLRAF